MKSYYNSRKFNQLQRTFSFIIVSACFFSVLSQMPFWVNEGITQLVCFPMWIILCLCSVIFSKGKIKKSVGVIIVPSILFLLMVLIDSLFTSNDYFSSSLLYSFLISMFIFGIGILTGKWCSKETIYKICCSYVLATVIVSVSIFVNYFGFSFDLSSKVYGYASKNSISQIIYTAIIILILKIKPEKTIYKACKIIIILFELLLLMFLKSRATIVGLVVCVIILAFSKKTNRKLKNIIVICGICLIIALFTSETFNDMIFNDILFAGREVTNWDSLSSGRVSIINQFPEIIEGHWLFGIGATYYECFPLSAIIQFGLIPGIVLIIISLTPLLLGCKRSKISEDWFLLTMIAVGYNINSIFEGVTPFGAGIKCFFLWFLLGILLSKGTKKE